MAEHSFIITAILFYLFSVLISQLQPKLFSHYKKCTRYRQMLPADFGADVTGGFWGGLTGEFWMKNFSRKLYRRIFFPCPTKPHNHLAGAAANCWKSPSRLMSPHHPHSTKLQRRASLIRGVLIAEAPVLAVVQPPRLLRPQPSVDVVQGSHRPCHLQPPPPPPAFAGVGKIAAIKLHCTKEHVLFGDFVTDHYSSLLTNWGSHWSYTDFGCRVYTSAS
ncbi:hypothetical protein PIB30_068298 [Stylosanthes scabra]|uniref:Uncharacterized protein n=1 Tax=Stylosanthes scabra TaxID=79078 RepID=A0ABU6WL89_9FABA|nr:hypothetical protein [Stylosanthes scabra]